MNGFTDSEKRTIQEEKEKFVHGDNVFYESVGALIEFMNPIQAKMIVTAWGIEYQNNKGDRQ